MRGRSPPLANIRFETDSTTLRKPARLARARVAWVWGGIERTIATSYLSYQNWDYNKG